MNNLKAERTLTAENRVSDEVLATMIAFEIHARDRYPAGSIGHETHRDQVRALTELQYLRSQSLSTQQPMGEGTINHDIGVWKLVPIRPTEEMVKAGRRMDDEFLAEPPGFYAAEEIYKAMVSASPPSPFALHLIQESGE